MLGGMSLSVAYGIKIQRENDPYVQLAEAAGETIQSASPGRFLVDIFPILRYVPQWFPGAGFKRLAAEWRKIQEDFHEVPFAAAMKALVSQY